MLSIQSTENILVSFGTILSLLTEVSYLIPNTYDEIFLLKTLDKF